LKLERIVVGCDGSDTARGAYRFARELATRTGARILVIRAVLGHRVLAGAYRDRSGEQRAELESWVDSVAPPGYDDQLAIEFGHPSIEIPRFAETHGADLLVLGRPSRTQAQRFRAGDTADAVMRRSVVPCLLVPPGASAPRSLLAAVDGTPRGRRVLDEARALAQLTGMSCRAVTVEPHGPSRLQAELDDRLRVRHGSIHDEVLAEIRETDAGLLAIGVRRGGPPGVLELGSVGRHLAHAAPCPVFTIPI
jgi:nucleotide-binding universal stress UspA family protein